MYIERGLVMKKNVKYILSDMIGCMIPKGFVLKYSTSDEVIIGKEHFSWNECECLYCSDDIDGSAYDYEDIHDSYVSRNTGRRIDFIFD